jgi:hypothetical protein
MTLDLIIISLKISLFSSLYSRKIAELVLSNNHSLTLILKDYQFYILWLDPKGARLTIYSTSKEIAVKHIVCSLDDIIQHPSSAVDRGFEPGCGQTKVDKIGICCFFAKHAALRRKSKDWLARNQNNVSEWSDIIDVV